MRIQILNEEPERTLAVVFETGDEPIAGLEKVARDQGLTAARLTGIGAFRRARLGFFDLDERDYLPIEIDEQVEVLSLVGNVTLAGSGDHGGKAERKVHVHVVVGKRDGTAHGGHLLEAEVRPTLEVVLVESPVHLRRHPDPATGLALLSG
jgi:uncharacterized protein